MTNMLNLHFLLFFSLIILTAIHHATAGSQNIVESLPGYPGKLPFHLETGYIGVGEEEGVQLFYYFIKSEGNPKEDPLMLWLTGGPGCSAISGLVFENGPLMYNTSACNWKSDAPTFKQNPFSWTKVASMIFLDSPVGTGFSYATKPKYNNSDDILQSKDIYHFTRKWLLNNAEFIDNPLYISGDSYCGKIVPIVVHEIINGNKKGLHPIMNIQGYVLGNPFTWPEDKLKQTIYFGRRVSLISDEIYESVTLNCNGGYEDEDIRDNPACGYDIGDASHSLNPLYYCHALKPNCISEYTYCQESLYKLLDYWANDKYVRESLHIRKGTKDHWIRCNYSLPYTKSVESTFGYHQSFTQESIRALIYSGDQDMVVPYTGTLKWIYMLNVSITENWRPWFVHNQVAGYATQFANKNYHLIHTTLKNGGHTAPENTRLESFDMITRWLAKEPL